MNTKELVKKYIHIFNTNYSQDANCKLAWIFEEGSGSTTTDQSSQNNTGNFGGVGNPSFANSTPSPPAAYSNYYVEYSNDNIQSNASVGIAHQLSSKSYVFWMYANSMNLGGWATQVDSTTSREEHMMTINTNTILFRHNGSTDLDVRSSDNSISTGAWKHIGITWDGSTTATNVHIYVDGVETTYKTQQNGAGLYTTSGYNTNLGTTQNFSNYYSGNFDDFAMFDRILSSTEINEIKDYGLVASGGGTIVYSFMTGYTKYW